MPGRLNGKVAIITGAANGMGAAFAARFVEEGAKVLLADIDAGTGARVAARLGDAAVFVELDVTDPEGWTRAVATARDNFEPVDVLVNDAGVSGDATQTADIDDAAWSRTIGIDLTGTFYGVRAVVPQMVAAGGGSIVNISSAAGMAAASASTAPTSLPSSACVA